ncbi:hypothetical protein KDA_20200 [Dictyobacter alpinus]|uniref:Uncharacterized protein n=1 Tax=Dictyobacter alpinus TaxID=2014873 RepID=A0A402B5C0_9CHLR|nr:hypothetical protein KDA_20200 [Dictyobacter alpinus]
MDGITLRCRRGTLSVRGDNDEGAEPAGYRATTLRRVASDRSGSQLRGLFHGTHTFAKI